MRVERKFIFALAFTILVLFSLSLGTPAQAIFGLSKCEKVKKAILSEQVVASSLHFDYTSAWYAHVASLQSDQLSRNVISTAQELQKSYLQEAKLAAGQPSCWKPSQVAWIREQVSKFSLNIRYIETYRTAMDKGTISKIWKENNDAAKWDLLTEIAKH